MLFPFSFFRISLETLALICTFFSCIYIPYLVGFVSRTVENSYVSLQLTRTLTPPPAHNTRTMFPQDNIGSIELYFIDNVVCDVVFSMDLLINLFSWTSFAEDGKEYGASRDTLLHFVFSKSDLALAHGGGEIHASPQSELEKLLYGTHNFGFDGLVGTHLRYNMWKYLTGGFSIDFLTIFPLEFIMQQSGYGTSSSVSTVRLIRFFRFLRMIKLGRLFRLTHRLKRLFGDISSGIQNIGLLIASMFFLSHVMCCFFHYAAIQPADGMAEGEGGLTWLATVSNFPQWTGNASHSVTANPVLPTYVPIASRYIASMYFVTFSLLSVGYGDVHAVSDCGYLCLSPPTITTPLLLPPSHPLTSSPIPFTINQPQPSVSWLYS